MTLHFEVRRGAYHDSVTLMLAGRAVSAVAGVSDALVGMATELNVGLLAGIGILLRLTAVRSSRACPPGRTTC